MKKLVDRFQNFMLFIFIQLTSLPVLADLPKPPDGDIPSGSTDAIDVGGTLLIKGLKIACIVVGAVIFIGGAAGIITAYKTAHEKQDLGHFFKHGFICLVSSALGFGLVYFGYNILTNQST
jgi:hypothetical protein